MKQCNYCNKEIIRKRYYDLNFCNKKCKVYYSRKTNPIHHKNLVIKRNYGIDLNDYKQMLNNQNGKCQICNNHMYKPNIDHCHKTGKVRGLLCNKCNCSIGLLQDSVSILKQAIKYLTKYK